MAACGEGTCPDPKDFSLLTRPRQALHKRPAPQLFVLLLVLSGLAVLGILLSLIFLIWTSPGIVSPFLSKIVGA